MLLVPGGFRALAVPGIIAAEHVKQVSGAQACHFVGPALLVNQQREVDSRLLLKNAGVVAIAQADRRERRAFVAEGLLMLAQLRDVLSAKNSAIVPEKNDDCGIRPPQ